MNRKVLHDALSSIASVHQLSNRAGVITKETLILRKKQSMASTSNGIGVHIYWEVICYVPSNSIVKLDALVNKVISCLKQTGAEITNVFGEDYYDDELKAYMSYVEFRTPKVLL